MRTHLLLVLLLILMLVARCAFGDNSSSLCTLEDDLVPVSTEDAKGKILYEFLNKASPDVPVTICLNSSERYRIAHSSSLVFKKLGLVLGHIVQFNKNFYDGAPIEVLVAVTAHEIVHRKDVENSSNQGDCLNKLQVSVAAYTECELDVDIKAAAMGSVGSCNMLESLRFIKVYWEKVALNENTTLDSRISWFEQDGVCNTN